MGTNTSPLIPIDFDNPEVVTHQGQRIPIDTQVKYDAAGKVVEGIHEAQGIACGVPTNAETGAPGNAETYTTLQARVCQGMRLREIEAATHDELDARYPETAG